MVSKTKRSRGETAVEHIDLCIRIRDDGGPTYAELVAIGNSYARGDRVRQLLYLGLMAERGLIGGGSLHATHVARPAPAPAPVVRPRDTTPFGPGAPAEMVFEADDLAAIFGDPQQ